MLIFFLLQINSLRLGSLTKMPLHYTYYNNFQQVLKMITIFKSVSSFMGLWQGQLICLFLKIPSNTLSIGKASESLISLLDKFETIIAWHVSIICWQNNFNDMLHQFLLQDKKICIKSIGKYNACELDNSMGK